MDGDRPHRDLPYEPRRDLSRRYGNMRFAEHVERSPPS